jgi:mono/diheme cytochrome c family protein
LLVLLAAGCATGVVVPRATDADARRAQRPVADLDRGRSLYLARCSRCHQAVAPSRLSAHEWPRQVEEMKQGARLDGPELELVLLYLTTMSSAPAASRAAR